MSSDIPPDRGKQKANLEECMDIENQAMDIGNTSKVSKKAGNLVKPREKNLVSKFSSNYKENLMDSQKETSNMKESSENNLSCNLNISEIINSNDKNAGKNLSADIPILYTNKDTGPYVVYVQNENGNIGKWHRISTAKLIINSVPEIENDITRISTIGINRVKVELTSANSANKLIKSEVLSRKQYNVYIPQFLKRRLGIIKNVDRDIPEEELITMIKPLFGNTFEIIHVKRLKRKIVQDNVSTYVPKQAILVSFKGQLLPSQVVIEKMVFNVEPYIQRVVQCLKCLRYGHLSTQCKGVERCSHCGEEHNSNNCEKINPPYCVLCKGEHSATERNVCPEFSKQKYIKNLMGIENLSYRDAVTKYSNSYSNSVQSNLISTTDANFSKQNTRSSPIQKAKYSTQPIKRKRIEPNKLPNNPLLEAHKNIISPINFLSQPVINKYPPQYHNLRKENKNDDNNKNIGDTLTKSIKESLQSNNIMDDSLIKIILDSVYRILKEQCII